MQIDNLILADLGCDEFSTFVNNFISINKIKQQDHMSKSKPAQTRRYQSKLGQSKVEAPKQTEADKYFRKLAINVQSRQKASKQLQRKEKSIIKSIYKEKLSVKQNPTEIKNLLVKQQIKQQERKENQLKKKREQLIKAIQNLDMRTHKQSESYKTIAKQYNRPELLRYKLEGILTKQQHEAMVQRIKQLQQAQNQKDQQRLEKLQRRFQEQYQKARKMDQQKLNTQKQLRRKRSQYNLSVRKQINQLQNAEQIRANKQLLQLKKKNFLHQILQDNFNNKVIIPNLEQKKKKLKEIREISRNFKVHDIDEHERRYLKERTKSMYLIQSKAKIAQEWKYSPPEKSQKLNQLLQNQLAKKKQQLQKSKKAIQQKLVRQQNFLKVLKQHSRVKIDIQKQKQVINRVESLQIKKRQPTYQHLQSGKNYLTHAKNMKKYSIQQSRQMQLKSAMENEKPLFQSSRVNYLQTKSGQGNSLIKRKQSLQKILNSKEQVIQKAQKLQIQTKKIEEEYKKKQSLLEIKAGGSGTRKDATQLLLSGIRAKMELIKLVN